MDPLALKLLSSLAAPAKWFYRLLAESTGIKIIPPYSEGWTWPSLPIQYRDSPDGLLNLAFTTTSKRSVEITEIRVEYASPLQLFDPGALGFFKSEISHNLDFPFCLVWKGNVEVRRNLLQWFAIHAKFPDTVQSRRIRISIQAKVIEPSLGGFLGRGRNHLTVSSYDIRLVSRHVQGLTVPPGAAASTPQPFLIKGAVSFSGNIGTPVKALLHELLEDGRTLTTEHRSTDA